jgi:phage shock protein A
LEKKLLQEVEKYKSELGLKSAEYQSVIENLKESFKKKESALDEKIREAEKKRSTMIFEHEKERTKWNLEKDHLISQRNDLSESINKLEKK